MSSPCRRHVHVVVAFDLQRCEKSFFILFVCSIIIPEEPFSNHSPFSDASRVYYCYVTGRSSWRPLKSRLIKNSIFCSSPLHPPLSLVALSCWTLSSSCLLRVGVSLAKYFSIICIFFSVSLTRWRSNVDSGKCYYFHQE